MKLIPVGVDLMQAIVNYLETKPHREVSVLIQEILRQCNPQPVEEKPKEEPKAEVADA